MLLTAARVSAAGATGGAAEDIAAVGADQAQVAVAADDASVKGIAKGMKGIVDAAGKLGVELAAGGAAAGTTNGAAGNLFAGAGATIAQIGNAVDAVSKVSGKQILKAIVDSDMDAAGAAPANAGSPIAAAIGTADGAAGAFTAANGNMDRDDNIAAAIVLRGMAASGKFAHGADDNGAAGKLGVELADGAPAGAAANGAAGNLFAGAGATIAQIGNAVDAVSKVSGKQILKAIVDSADEAGAAPANAGSPIAAAIGTADGAAGAFTAANGNMDRDDNIAAAIVLRGMAASGKFAHGADDNGAAGIKKGMKIAVESAVNKISGLIKEMVTAARVGAAGATGTAGDAIAAVAAADEAQAAVGGVEASVKGIAKGMKGIVEAAGKLGVELAAGAVAGVANAAAGNLFAGNGAANAIAHVGNAVDAVSKVSGKQILKAIVDSAEENGAGAQPADAGSPIAAAIGAGEAGNFANGMERDDNIAAAIVLRGMAASGKFAHAADNDGALGIKKGMKIAVDCCESECCWCYWCCS
ncbi:variable large family protein [Borreliella lusitaniae]|uniref:variable large family protein n=1 Tax=Borreliella lusitaniae TaxID=100177 RepID=UPI003C77BA7E